MNTIDLNLSLTRKQVDTILAGLWRQKEYFKKKIEQDKIDFKNSPKAVKVFNASNKRDIEFVEEIEAMFQ